MNGTRVKCQVNIDKKSKDYKYLCILLARLDFYLSKDLFLGRLQVNQIYYTVYKID